MKQPIMLLACLVGLAANAQYTTVINTDSLCPIIDAPILDSHLSEEYQYINTPMELTINQTVKYVCKLGFTDLISDLKVDNCTYRLYKARNPETGDECWITYNYNSEDKPAYGIAYVFKDKKTMPKDFKKLAKDIGKDNYKYYQWKNRLVICENYFGISETENILKTGKYKVPSSVGSDVEYEKPIKVIVVSE